VKQKKTRSYLKLLEVFEYYWAEFLHPKYLPLVTGLSKATVYRFLKELLDEGKIVKLGEAPHSGYKFNINHSALNYRRDTKRPYFYLDFREGKFEKNKEARRGFEPLN
jgi:hypothetical protein